MASAQVSIARRLVKEVAHYEAETKKDEARVEAMRADPTKDEYDVKKICLLYTSPSPRDS